MQCIFKFKDAKEVLERANNTHYGLAAGIFTNDMNKALALADDLQAGVVW